MNPDPPPKYSDEPPPSYAQQPPMAGYAPQPQPYSYGVAQPPPPPPGYNPQPTGYNPQPTGYNPQTTVVVHQPHMGALPGSTMRFGQHPALIVCQHCQATVTTSLNYKTGLLTWLLAGGICIVGCWFGCCFIPFCLDAAKDVEHSCPNCKREVGMFRHIR